jgi:DNA-repair protein complementing XP-A cells
MDRKQLIERLQDADRAYQSQQEDLRKVNSHKDGLTCDAIIEDDKVCGNSAIDLQLYENFQEKICYDCKARNHDLYRLVSKQEAMKQFLVSDDSFQLFKFISKPNPHNPHWQPMKLFLSKHILQFSLLKYGTVENLEKEKQKRDEKKYEKTLQKTETILSEKSFEFRQMIDNQKTSLPLDTNESEEGNAVESKEPKGFSTISKQSKKTSKPHQTRATKKRKLLELLLPSITGEEPS